MKAFDYESNIRSERRRLKVMLMIIALIILIIFLTNHQSVAAEKNAQYQIITGSDEKAYLLDTATGFTWILTYRTMATGREPIALPYKFIRISPQNQKDFILETQNGISLPPP